VIIDPRAGSEKLIAPVRKRLQDEDAVMVTQLSFGDVAFLGNGPEGPTTVRVGIEYKTVGDLLSCINNGRFSGTQLPGLRRTYDVVYLLVEGGMRWKGRDLLVRKGNKWGVVQWGNSGRAPTSYSSPVHWLMTMEAVVGIKVHHTFDLRETVEWLVHLESWWDKKWSSHNAHVAFDESGYRATLRSSPRTPEEWSREYVRLFAKELPGVGWARADAVSTYFATPTEMISASVKEWEKIPGIGKTTAERAVKALRGTSE
jgi:ERCC4-type nuclease